MGNTLWQNRTVEVPVTRPKSPRFSFLVLRKISWISRRNYESLLSRGLLGMMKMCGCGCGCGWGEGCE